MARILHKHGAQKSMDAAECRSIIDLLTAEIYAYLLRIFVSTITYHYL